MVATTCPTHQRAPSRARLASAGADPTEHIRAVLHGLSGKVIGGVTYGSAMPAFAEQLTDEEVAAVLTHERTSWGTRQCP